MDGKVIENERTAKAQHITRQPDGAGKRIGKKGKFPPSARLLPAEQNCSGNACHRFKLKPPTGNSGSGHRTTSG